MLEIVDNPFVRKRSSTGALLGSWHCNMKIDKLNIPCKRVELSYAAMLLHLAVEHGVRPLKRTKDDN